MKSAVIKGGKIKKGDNMKKEETKKTRFKAITENENGCRFKVQSDKCRNPKGGYSTNNPGPCSLETCPRVND